MPEHHVTPARSRRGHLLASSILALAVHASSGLALPVRVPGTRVTIDPPASFKASERFPGFEMAEKGASITVTELPGPASAMQQGMTKDALATRGMNLIRSEPVKAGGQDAVLLNVSQAAAGKVFLKWMLIAGDAGKTVMVVGTFPREVAELSLPIRKAVLSTRWSSGSGKAPPFEGLTFRVSATPKLKLAGRLGNMLVFSESGSMEPSDADQGLLVFGSSLSEASIQNVEAFARQRVSQTTSIGPLINIEGHALTVDGLPGYELLGDTNDMKSGRALRMYQLVLADQKTYYLAQGFVAPPRAAEFVTQFRKVTGSFRKLRPPK